MDIENENVGKRRADKIMDNEYLRSDIFEGTKEFCYTQEMIEKIKYYALLDSKNMENRLCFNEFLDSIVLTILKDFNGNKLEIIAPGHTYNFEYIKPIETKFDYLHEEAKLTILNLFRKLFKLDLKMKRIVKKIPLSFTVSGVLRVIYPMSECAEQLKKDSAIYINAPAFMPWDKQSINSFKKLLFNRMWVDKDLEINIHVTNINIENNQNVYK